MHALFQGKANQHMQEQVTTQAFALPVTGAAFSAPTDTVVRKGKIFAAGEYEDVGYSMSAEELADAVRNFQPVPVDLDHHNTVLDNMLGTLEAVELSQDGQDLIGFVAFPKWLDDVLGTQARKVSCTWDTATKQLRKLALTNNPRVTDAALFTAYATFAGARHSSADMADMQKMHDMTVKQGAQCSPDNMPKSAGMSMPAHAHTNNRTTMNTLGNAQANKQKETTKMTFMDKLADFLKGVPANELAEFTGDADGDTSTTTTTTTTPTPTPSPTPSPTPDPQVAALKAQLATQTAQFAQIVTERRTEKATAKVDALIAAGKLLPYERGMAIARFTRDMQDDEKDASLVTFSDAEGNVKNVTRAQLTEMQYQARTAHGLTQEQVVAFALPAQGTNAETEAEHEKKLNVLIGVTSMGKAAMNGSGSANGTGK